MQRNSFIIEVIAKVVTPVKTGVQYFRNAVKFLDSGFRRNDILCMYTTFAITSMAWSVILLLIAGASHDDAYAMATQKSKQTPPANYRFDPAEKPDPFRPFVEKEPVLKKKAEVANVSIFPLQKVDLDQFNLIGIAGDAARRVAIVETKDSKGSSFYTLTLGTVIGLNKGRVVEIKSDLVVVEESTPLRSGKKINRITKKLRKDEEEGTP